MTEPPPEPHAAESDQFTWLTPAAQPPIGSAEAGGGLPAVPESVPYEVQAYPMPAYNETYPTQTYGRMLPAEVYPPQPAEDAPWPLITGEPPKPRRRPSLVLGLVIALVLVIAGGATAAFVLIGPASSRGSASPQQAVDGFLDGIYAKHSAKDAGRFVCERARNDQELDQIVFGVKTFEQEFLSARTTWSYPEIRPAARQATASVTLTMTTANEQVAEKQITLLLVDDRGWWVCDVQTPE
jgi:hypothetical protein